MNPPTCSRQTSCSGCCTYQASTPASARVLASQTVSLVLWILEDLRVLYALSLLDDAVWRGSPHPTFECPPSAPLCGHGVDGIRSIRGCDIYQELQGLRTPELRKAMSLDEIGWLSSSGED